MRRAYLMCCNLGWEQQHRQILVRLASEMSVGRSLNPRQQYRPLISLLTICARISSRGSALEKRGIVLSFLDSIWDCVFSTLVSYMYLQVLRSAFVTL